MSKSANSVFNEQDAATIAALEWDAGGLSVTWADGGVSRYPAIWLRDNAPDGRHAGNGQRLFDISSLPDDITLTDAALLDGGEVSLGFAPEEVEATFSAGWLYGHRLDAGPRKVEKTLWRAGSAPAEAEFDTVSSNAEALHAWLTAIRDRGVALLRGVPPESQRIFDVVDLFGYVRETNYGRLFDVVSEPEPVNLAFSNLGLGLHTDNPYRDPVPGLQLLHCLVAESDGGESVVVDGFAVAERLREEAPEDFELLTRYSVPFAFRAKGVELQSRSPLIELDAEGEVYAIRYNNRSAAPLDMAPEAMDRFYKAYRRFGRLLHDPEFAVSFRLAPGDLFIVDNRRVLHGRKGFSGGRRHLQGCYADKDSLESKIAVLEREL